VIRSGRIIAVAAITIALATGCSTAPSPPPPAPPPGMTLRALCDSLLAFFANELHAVDQIPETLVNMDVTISVGGSCDANNRELRRTNGIVQVRNTPTDVDPTYKVPGFVQTTELGETVWVLDNRKDTKYASTNVDLATRIGEWNGKLRIMNSVTQTTNGPLNLTEEEIHKAARYLVELTKELSKIYVQPLR
jgi:hypothetical protein